MFQRERQLEKNDGQKETQISACLNMLSIPPL